GVGANGFPEGGAGDDVPMPTQMTWAWSGPPAPDVDLAADGKITAGRFTGMATINVSGNGLSKSFTLRVVPPQWNPIFRGFEARRIRMVAELVPIPAHPADLFRVNRFFRFEENGKRLLFVVQNTAFIELDAASWALAEMCAGKERVRRSEVLREL